MLRRDLLHSDLTASVIRAFYEVYNRLGDGLPEHVHMMALERELRWAGHDVAREVGVQVLYKGEELTMMRIDAVVDRRLVVEAKSTDVLHPSAKRQLYNYLRCTRLELGLLPHFGPEPQFHRILCPNSRMRRATSPTDEGVKADAPDAPETANPKGALPFPEHPEHPS